MEQLTTKRLNDQIIHMRKEVKRAIVHQIHRLTTAAKRLRNKKGTEEQKQKNAIKADNMVVEITILKKMKPDDVSVFGLTNFEEVEVKNFLSRRVVAPETRAMAKLCLRKNLRSVIDQFIKEIGSVHSRLMDLLDERQQHKEKKEKKKLKKQENNEEINHEYDNTSDSTLDSSDESIPMLLPAKSDSDHVSENETLNLLINNKNDVIDKIIGIDDNLDLPLKVKTKPVREERNIKNSSDSESDSDFVQHVDKIINSDDNQNVQDKRKEVSKIESKPLERKNVDPFFMTRDNSEYRTYCDIGANAKKEKDESDQIKIDNDDKNSKNNYKKGNFSKNNHSKDNSFNKNKNNQRFDSRKTITYLGGNDKKSFDKKGFRRGEKRPHNEEPPSNVKLHPSWEAKKKLAVSTVPFQGKKITFDD
ncbi:unnamed protein product [Nezara viridula]|uniref:Serum response factor-binding protein 1 n=1 Tax=Nezara viridula TaxID=85310 RepID=A0A9P0HM32_NEZVI|nr:unnamed protein product [Nezara viridula]